MDKIVYFYTICTSANKTLGLNLRMTKGRETYLES